MSKAFNKTAFFVIPLTLLGVIQMASVSSKLMQIEIVTPLVGLSLNTCERGIGAVDSSRCHFSNLKESR